jgi:hypothetical protein
MLRTHDRRLAAQVRVALIPPAVLLLIVGVWLLPALTSLDTLSAALIGIAWLVVLIAALRVLTVKLRSRASASGDLFVDDEERSEWLAQFVTLSPCRPLSPRSAS